MWHHVCCLLLVSRWKWSSLRSAFGCPHYPAWGHGSWGTGGKVSPAHRRGQSGSRIMDFTHSGTTDLSWLRPFLSFYSHQVSQQPISSKEVIGMLRASESEKIWECFLDHKYWGVSSKIESKISSCSIKLSLVITCLGQQPGQWWDDVAWEVLWLGDSGHLGTMRGWG